MSSSHDHYASVVSQIIILSRFRDAVRKVPLTQIFKTPQRRDEFYMAIIEALEDLEDELEEIEDQKMKSKEESS